MNPPTRFLGHHSLIISLIDATVAVTVAVLVVTNTDQSNSHAQNQNKYRIDNIDK